MSLETDTPDTACECPVCNKPLTLATALGHCKAHRELGRVSAELENLVANLESRAVSACGVKPPRGRGLAYTVGKSKVNRSKITKKQPIGRCPLCDKKVSKHFFWSHIKESHKHLSPAEQKRCRKVAKALGLNSQERATSGTKQTQSTPAPIPKFAKSGMVIKGTGGKSSDWGKVK